VAHVLLFRLHLEPWYALRANSRAYPTEHTSVAG
jgi:hypothetical protein